MRLVFAKIPENDIERFPDDISRMVRACADHGYEISRADAKEAWHAHSGSLCAHWLAMNSYSDAALFGVVKGFCRVEP